MTKAQVDGSEKDWCIETRCATFNIPTKRRAQYNTIKYVSQNLGHGKYQTLHVSAPKCHVQGVC